MKWHCFFGFFKFPKFQIGIAFFVFLALVLARIRNWKLYFFLGFFWFIFGFFGLGFGQHSKLETGFLGFFGFFLVLLILFFLNFLVFLAFDLRVRML